MSSHEMESAMEMVFRILGTGNIFWIILLQFPIQKTHWIRQSSCQTDEMIPTTPELCVTTFAFWTLKFTLSQSLNFIAQVLFGDSLNPEMEDWIPIATATAMDKLLKPFLATWMIHIALVASIEIIGPTTYMFFHSPKESVVQISSRYQNMVAFLILLFSSPLRFSSPPIQTKKAPLAFPPFSTSNENTHRMTTQLVRKRIEAPTASSPRTLDWTFKIDTSSLAELKETLGPPGGFGELGFCVQKDGVKFECMGPGTSFNLNFKLPPEELMSPAYPPVNGMMNGNGNGNSTSSGKPRKKRR